MNQLTAFIFLLVFGLSNTAAKQLMRLPGLIHHYTDHHHHDALEDNLSFVEFVKKHYAEDAAHAHKSATKHENLPFKSIETPTTTTLALPDNFLITTENLVMSPQMETTFSQYQSFSVEGIFGSVWQPPRA